MKHNYEQLVHQALSEPAKNAAAYSAFWNYSLGNQFLAFLQLGKAEPINTYKGWQGLGRQVQKGAKAIELLMPVVKKAEAEGERDQMFFISRKNWFGLSQTEGETFVQEVPNFNIDKMLSELGIKREEFKAVNGNAMGYAKTQEKTIAISPLAFDAFKTTIHETAHCLLHDDVTMHSELTRDVKEVEAELTAYLVKSCLGLLDNLAESRGYIQAWINNTSLEKVRFSKVFGAVDKILKAGR